MGAFWETFKMNKGRCLLSLFVWLLFEFVRLIFAKALNPSLRSLQKLLWRWKDTMPHDRGTVVIERVLGRWKFDVMQPNNVCDFICAHKQYCTSEDLMNLRWSLYSLTANEAIFVRMPLPLSAYQAYSTSMLYIAQHCNATHVARMPLWQFCQWGAELEQTRPSTARIVQFSVTGGTAEDGLQVLRLCMRANGVQCYNDVDYFTSVAALHDNYIWDDNFTTQILRAALNVFCKNIEEHTMIIVKNRCFSNQLLHLCRRATPNTKHVFLYTRNIAIATNTLARQLASRRIVRTVYEWKRHGGAYLDDVFIMLSRLETSTMQRVRPATLWEYAAVALAVSYQKYLQCLQHDSQILALSVEQLTLCKRQELMRLYSWLGIPLDNIDAALEHLVDDALNNRPDFSDGVDQMRSEPDRCTHLARLMQLPENFYGTEFVFDHRLLFE